MHVIPVTLRYANQFVQEHHRTHGSVRGMKFAVGLVAGDEVVGVAIAGRPVARALDDGVTIEILRCCVIANQQNGCSMLYGALRRAAKALGYRRVVTYTLEDETGASVRAAGFIRDGTTKDRQWLYTGQLREQREMLGDKIRWLWTL